MKQHIPGLVVGACIMITIYAIWGVFSMNSRVSNLEGFATQVSSLISQAQKSAAPVK